MKYKSVRTAFKDYVSRIKNADHFLRTEGSIRFYQALSPTRKSLVYHRLQACDPKGLEKMFRLACSVGAKARWSGRLLDLLPDNSSRRADLAIVEKRVQEQGVVGKVSIVSLEGFKRLLAASLAIYKPEEVAAFAGMELSSLNTLVTVEDVKVAKKLVPEAIRTLADQIVLKDLSLGQVTNQTEAADKISARRTKLAIEAHKEMRETEKEDEELEKRREKEIRERFGVNRETGYVEVKP